MPRNWNTIPNNSRRNLLLSLLELSGIELQLLALKDISIATATLAGSGRHGAQKAATGESLLKSGVKGAGLLSLGLLSLNVVGKLLVGGLLGGGLSLGLLHADLHAVVLLVPSLERGRVNLDNGVLHEGLGADQLVVGGVVDDIQNSGLSGGHCVRIREKVVTKAS